MSAWTAVLLAAVVLAATVRAAADVLNLGALRPELPDAARAVYDQARYCRAQEYARARIRFGLVTSAVRLAFLVAFWLGGGFGLLDRWARALGAGPVPAGLLFFAALGVGEALLGLPARWYATFVLEERFGFNRTTRRTFWADVARGALLTVLIGGPLLAGVLWLLGTAGRAAWVWCWGAAAGWTLVVQYVAPAWILPLFNRFSPLEPGPLRDAILAYARGVGFPLAGVSVIDGSRRSTKANAFFTGFGARKRIALFDTLLAGLSPEEVLAVVAHEVGHYKLHHVLRGLALGILHVGATFFLLSIVLRTPSLVRAVGVDVPSVHAALVAFALLLAPLELLLALGLNAVSRRQEREADTFAVETTGGGRALADALVRLSADTLANLTPHPLYVALHHSHPPVLERLRRLAEADRSVALPAGCGV